MKPGKALEQLVAIIERSVGNNDEVTVELGKRLRDCRTGRLREHDVVLTFHSSHHELVVAIECRDRSRPTGVPQLEAFYTKCSDTGIDQGIIVSAKGFYKSTLLKADQLGICCFQLEEAEQFDWLRCQVVSMQERHMTGCRWNVQLGISMKRNESAELRLETISGDELTEDLLWANAFRALQAMRGVGEDAGTHSVAIEFDASSMIVKERNTGKLMPLARVTCIVDYEIIHSTAPLELSTYSDANKGSVIANIAKARIRGAGLEGDLVIVYDTEKGGKIVFHRDSEDM